jgi:hypothetical protein
MIPDVRFATHFGLWPVKGRTRTVDQMLPLVAEQAYARELR